MITVPHPPRSMYEVWETLPEGTLCQLINNELVMAPAPLDVHQSVLNEINIELALFLRKNKAGYVRIAPYDVHFSKTNILQPDICFIAAENKHIIGKNGLTGIPDLIIEVLSPSTKKYDLNDKRLVYEKYGVKEYFIVEPTNKKVKSYVLKRNSYTELPQVKGIIKSGILKTTILF